MQHRVYFQTLRREIYSVVIPADSEDEAAQKFMDGKFDIGDAEMEKMEKIRNWELILIGIETIRNEFLDEMKKQIQ